MVYLGLIYHNWMVPWMCFYISSFPIKTESVRTPRHAIENGADVELSFSVLDVASFENNEMNLESRACVEMENNGVYILDDLSTTNLLCDTSAS